MATPTTLRIPVGGTLYTLPYPQRAPESWQANSVVHESLTGYVHRDFRTGKAHTLLSVQLTWERLLEAEVALVSRVHALLSDMKTQGTLTLHNGDSYTVQLASAATELKILRYQGPEEDQYYDTSLSLEQVS